LPLVSIIIATFNASSSLERTLESIACQKCNNWEVLIMDGNSTDNTKDIVDLFSSKLSISWFSEMDDGIYDAMNKGIKRAKGEWIYFMGADDVLNDKDVLTNIFAEAIYENIVYGDIIWLPSNIKEEGKWSHRKFLNQNINHQRIFYQSSLFSEYGDFDTRYKVAADHELNIRFFCNPKIKWKYVPVLVGNYHAYGFSANKTDEVFWDNWESIVLKNFSAYLPKKEIYSSLSWYCWYSIQQKKYRKAFKLFCKIYSRNFSFSFLKHSLSQAVKGVAKK
jgi:glycosyltransferase involved in cell wall biosynthesis